MKRFTKFATAASVVALIPLSAAAATDYEIEQGMKYGDLSTTEMMKLRDAGQAPGTTYSVAPEVDAVITDPEAAEDAAYGNLSTVDALDIEDRVTVVTPTEDPALETVETSFDGFLADAAVIAESPLKRANVVTEENQMLGFVQEVYQKPNGQEYAWIKIENEIGVEHDDVLVPVERVSDNGALILGDDLDFVRNGLTPEINSYNMDS